jgi:hypothetical protein
MEYIMKTYVRKIGVSFGYCQNTNDIINLKRYLNERIDELEKMADSTNPVNRNSLIFTLCLSYLDFLCCHINDDYTTGKHYKSFVKKYLKSYNFKIDKLSFVDILYGLRCGCVHNYAIQHYIQNKHKTYISDLRIVLSNRNDAKSEGITHLERVKIDIDGKTNKAVVIVAEDFVNDLKNVTNNICNEIDTNKSLKKRILNAFNRCPPIAWYGYELK